MRGTPRTPMYDVTGCTRFDTRQIKDTSLILCRKLVKVTGPLIVWDRANRDAIIKLIQRTG